MNKKELDVIKKFIKNQIIVSKDKYDELEQKLYSNSCTLNDRIDYALDKAHYSGMLFAYMQCLSLIESSEECTKFFNSLSRKRKQNEKCNKKPNNEK